MMKLSLFIISIFCFHLPANALVKRAKNASATFQIESRTTLNATYKTGNFYTGPRVGRHRPTDEDRYYSSIEGMVAFTSTILSLACLIALSITSVQFFIIPALAFATLATVLGAVGLKRMKPGYAIAGLVVGLIELVAGFAVLANLPPL